MPARASVSLPVGSVTWRPAKAGEISVLKPRRGELWSNGCGASPPGARQPLYEWSPLTPPPPKERRVRMSVRALFAFPDPVNEVSARLVAAGVVLMSLATIVLDQPWVTAVIAYGFVARVLSGPT